MYKPNKRDDLIYPDESYKIVGILFDVYNELGSGHHEQYYQRATEAEFKSAGFAYKSQVYVPLLYRGKVVGREYFDFLVEDKIILEIKKGDRFSHKHIKQVSQYLKTSGYKLAILANFGNKGVTFKRIVNYS